MRRIVVLDSSPLSRATNPRASAENEAIKQWLFKLVADDHIVIVPEIADYEVRRELIRAKKTEGIKSLDLFKIALNYLPLDTETMLEAAQLWAASRNSGKPATGDLALDGDMILVAQSRAAARVFAEESQGGHVMIATSNTKHLRNFCDARVWQDID